MRITRDDVDKSELKELVNWTVINFSSQYPRVDFRNSRTVNSLRELIFQYMNTCMDSERREIACKAYIYGYLEAFSGFNIIL